MDELLVFIACAGVLGLEAVAFGAWSCYLRSKVLKSTPMYESYRVMYRPWEIVLGTIAAILIVALLTLHFFVDGVVLTDRPIIDLIVVSVIVLVALGIGKYLSVRGLLKPPETA